MVQGWMVMKIVVGGTLIKMVLGVTVMKTVQGWMVMKIVLCGTRKRTIKPKTETPGKSVMHLRREMMADCTGNVRDVRNGSILVAWDFKLETWAISYVPDDRLEDEHKDLNLYLIGYEKTLKEMNSGFKRVLQLLSYTENQSKMDWLQRHCSFVERLSTLKEQRNGFGWAIFTNVARDAILTNIYDNVLEEDPKRIYSGLSRLIGLSNAKLKSAWKKDSSLAERYARDVLWKEAMIAIMLKLFRCSYHSANKDLSSTEDWTAPGAELKQRCLNLQNIHDPIDKLLHQSNLSVEHCIVSFRPQNVTVYKSAYEHPYLMRLFSRLQNVTVYKSAYEHPYLMRLFSRLQNPGV
ncbi:hypothetical protein MAR_020289 [Mya arenaria]|uniref:Uncharacterized protein n=1 Tax=Mya arenaria TaxID=6604 RepID=A0ABY7E511_MYAAR|nr:hypothetical protein MAR_020289 [Mya arenaria]